MLLFTVLAMWCASGGALGALSASARDKPIYPEAAHAQLFKEFKATHHKQYTTPEEEQHRFEIFKNKLNEINQLNAKYKHTVYGITKFTDLTTEEFTSQYTGLLVDKSSKPSPPPLTNLSIQAPDAFDWRDRNVVTRVKNQGRCGSCWAFATIGSLESHYAIKHKQLVEFSEQQLVDCDKEGADGCHGGDPRFACSYITSKGEEKESDYPYINSKGTCKYDANKVATRAAKCQNYGGSSEDDVKNLLYSKGPLVIGLCGDVLQQYQGGILSDCTCDKLDHAVLLVGYGIEKGVPFWTVKNSWDTGFGEKGYFRMQRGVNCLHFTDVLVLPVQV